MQFCTVVLNQIDEETAEIKTVVNTDVLMVLLRKKVSTTEFYANLKSEIIRLLCVEFNIDWDSTESLGELQQRINVGVNNQGHSFISVLSFVKIKYCEGGLTEPLADAILEKIQEALKEETPPPMSQEETVQILGWLSESINKNDHTTMAFYDKRFKRAVDRAIELLK